MKFAAATNTMKIQRIREQPKIAAIMIVRNEADIIEHNILNILQQCDRIFVADNGSTDDTVKILSKFKEIEVYDFKGLYKHAEAHNFMIRKCSNFDWVVPIDGDEFWTGIRSCLKHKNANAIKVLKIHNHIIVKEEARFSREHMVFFKTEKIDEYPRVMFRPVVHGRSVTVDDGTHNCDAMPVEVSGEIEIHHYPIRSRGQYLNKIMHGYGSFIERKLDKMVGRHWRPWHEAIDGKRFDSEFSKLISKNKFSLV